METIYYHIFTENVPVDNTPVHPIESFMRGSSMGVAVSQLPVESQAEYTRLFIEGLHKHHPCRYETLANDKKTMTSIWPFSRIFVVWIRK